MRTPKQRLADVVFELATNRDATTRCDHARGPGRGLRHQGQGGHPAHLDRFVGVVDGTNPDGQVEMIGVGPVPRQILQTLFPDTELAGIIFDR
ncbi:MAG: hypothetical protein F4X74_07790 [Acidimicrobiia bacterium]|nr:hypothetical protein [Acidimicrobiia bacterium]